MARHVVPVHDSIIAERAIPRSVWKAAGEAGLLGLEVPEEYGGSEANDFRFNAVFLEELAKESMAFASSFSIQGDIVAPYLVKLTSPEQRERWLPGYVSGDILGAIAMTEPAVGSDLANLSTRAVPDGDSWVINGSKTYITNGLSADLVVVAAKTDRDAGAKGISMFAVEHGTEGFVRGKKLDKVGQPESDTAELFFEDVRVPKENLLGKLNHGFFHMMTFLPQERIAAAVANLAHARQTFDETLAYAKDRVAFGQPIGSMQYNKFLLAELITELETAQAFVDAAVVQHAHRELSAVDAAKAKWWSAKVQNRVIDACVQLYGGAGYMNEIRAARAWKDARVTRIWAGSEEIMKEIIGRDLGL
ncbi:acyl-CoA dehydrogenase family protein [Microbacterium lacus]|uniref:acyl-CoA dehydrogenase family protein n=1 Tax=Microbacterium lacus TaxID=415217 RepID=UPI00384D9ADC